MNKVKEIWILVADDDRAHRDMLRANLEHAGYSVMEVTNGQEAVRCVKTQHPDLVLMDMRMPEMDGLTATRIIRAMNRKDAKEIPIIALTANALDEDVQRSMQAGLNAHLTKPVESEILYETLESLIKA